MEVRVGGRFVGRAVAVRPDVALTADHVVRENPTDDITVMLADGQIVKVRSVVRNSAVDVAALTLDTNVTVPSFGDAADGSRWRTPTGCPEAQLPELTGVVTTRHPSWRNAHDQQVPAFQLEVDQALGSFQGYSGAAVVDARDSEVVVGMLVEQHLTSTLAGATGNSNIIYALPIAAAIEAVGLELPTIRASRPILSGLLAYHEDVVRSLRGYRSRLTSQALAFVEPPKEAAWHPAQIWSHLSNSETSGAVLLTGHGGVGKTRTMLEVGDLAKEDGWDVIHVRGGNTSRVSESISDLLGTGHSRPILLLVDYLHIAHEIDLPALADLAASDREPKPRLSLLATSRTGWEIRHRRDAGMDRLAKIQLSRTDTDAKQVCESIVTQIAPTATAAFGAGAVLDVTGSLRPILAVLLGQIIETQYRSTGRLPAALVSEDLASWLDARLLEDEILAGEANAGGDLPDHLMAAAVALAAAPASLGELTTIAASALPDHRREFVAYTLEKLLKIGWLEETDDGVAPAHDVVVDKLLEAAVFHHETGVARESCLTVLLGTAFSSPRAFGRVIAALERVMDERDLRAVSNENLTLVASAWLKENASRLTGAIASDPPSAARIAVQGLESAVWSLPVEKMWAMLVSPVLTTIASSPLAAEPLHTACKVLPIGTQPPIGALAVRWLQGCMVDEFVLNAALERKDLDAAEVSELVALALESLPPRAGLVSADFTLRRLLMRAEVVGKDLVLTANYAQTWLEQFGTTTYAAHLLAAVVNRRDVPEEVWSDVNSKARNWVSAHVMRRDASHVLSALIRMSREFDSELWQVVTGWLHWNEHRVDTVYVLQSLLSREDLLPNQVSTVFEIVGSWLQNHTEDPACSFLLKALLTSSHTRAEYAALTCTAVNTWLAAQTDHSDVDFVVRAALNWVGWNDASEPYLWPHARRWLLRNSARERSRFVLVAALDQRNLSESTRSILWECTQVWIAANGSSKHASHVLQSLVKWPGLVEARATAAWIASTGWLDLHAEHDSAPYLLRAMLDSPLSMGETEVALWNLTVEWGRRHSDRSSALIVLTALLGRTEPGSQRAQDLRPIISAWLAGFGETPTAGRLIKTTFDFIAADPGFRVSCLWSATETWLAANLDDPGAGRILSAALTSEDLDLEKLATLLPFVIRWTDENPDGSYVASVIRATVNCPFVPENDAVRLWGYVTGWLARSVPNAYFIGTLQDLLAWPSLTGFALEPVLAAAKRALLWDDSDGGGFLIVRLAESSRISIPEMTVVWTGVIDWLQRQTANQRASHPLQALHSSPHLSPEMAPELWEVTHKWVAINSDTAPAFHVLRAAARSPHASVSSLKPLWPAYETWLERSSTEAKYPHLAQATLASPGLVPTQVDSIWSRSESWLSVHADRASATYLIQDWLRVNIHAHDRADVLWDAASRWLTAHGQNDTASYLIIGLARWNELTPMRGEALVNISAAWLTANSGSRAGVQVIAELLKSSAISNRRLGELGRSAASWLAHQQGTRARQAILRVAHSDTISKTRRGVFLTALSRPAHAMTTVRK